MVFKSCGSMLPIVAVVVWGGIVQGRIFSRNFAPEAKQWIAHPYRSDKNKAMFRKGDNFPNSFHSG